MTFQKGTYYGKRRPTIGDAPPSLALPANPEEEAPPEQREVRYPTPIPIADIDYGPIRPLTRFDREVWGWTILRMRQTWPHLSDNQAVTQLYSASASNDFHMIWHDAAAGMAHAGFHPLTGERLVRQIFLYIRPDEIRIKRTRISAGGQLYRAFERWAREMKAIKYEMEANSDLDPAEIVECLKAKFYDTCVRDLTKLTQL